MTQELLVKDPVCVLFTDVDVDHGTGEEPGDILSVFAIPMRPEFD